MLQRRAKSKSKVGSIHKMTDIKIRGKFTVEELPGFDKVKQPLRFLQLKLFPMQPFQVEAFSAYEEKEKKVTDNFDEFKFMFINLLGACKTPEKFADTLDEIANKIHDYLKELEKKDEN